MLQAGILGDTGRVFALDMGEPVHIVDLAKDMARLSGFSPGVDIDIQFTGARPGEKFFEELFTDGEKRTGLRPPQGLRGGPGPHATRSCWSRDLRR